MASTLKRYTVRVRTSVTAAGNTVAALIPPNNGSYFQGQVFKIGVSLATPVQSELALGILTDPGTPNAFPATKQGIAMNWIAAAGAPDSGSMVCTSFAVAPTYYEPDGAGLNYLRGIILPAALGSAVEWEFPEDPSGVVSGGVSPGFSGLGIINMGAAPCGLLDVFFEWGMVN